jgi:transposase
MINQAVFDRSHIGENCLILIRASARRELHCSEMPDFVTHYSATHQRVRKRYSFLCHQAQISGGTISLDGRIARDVMLGLSKTCRKLGISFYQFLGDRLGLGVTGKPIPPLSALVMTAN